MIAMHQDRLWIAALAITVLLPLDPGSARADNLGTWSVLPPPSGRHSHSALLDAAHDRIIVYGGDDGNRRDDTWGLELAPQASWVRMMPGGSGPGARFGHSAVLDSARQRMLLFGTDDDHQPDNVWALSLDAHPQWTPLSPAGSLPIGLHYHSTIYDPVLERMIVFGGISTTRHDEVWALELSGAPQWHLLTPAGTSPAARDQHTAIYDPIRDRMIVFGGEGNDSTARNDVWALDLSGATAWTQLSPAGAPPPARYGHAAVYDTQDDAMIVIGGNDGDSLRNDVWKLSLAGAGEWTELAPTGTEPAPREHHSATYDPERDRIILVAGEEHSNKNDVWALFLGPSPRWESLLLQGGPPRRGSTPIVYDATRDRMLFFGGVSRDFTDDTYQYQFGTDPPRWSRIPVPAPLPHSREMHLAFNDVARDRMIVFGGLTYLPWNDTWALSLAGPPEWTLLDPATGPTSDFDVNSGIYDPVRNRMIVFGGTLFGNPADRHAELWVLNLEGSPAWSRWDFVGDVPPWDRLGKAVFDPVRDRMLMICPGDARTSGVWQLPLSGPPTWSFVPTAGTAPPNQWNMTLVYDPVRDRVVMFQPADSAPGDQTWALALSPTPAWSQLPSFAPAVYSNVSLYDSRRDRMVLYHNNEMTALTWGEPTHPTVSCADTLEKPAGAPWTGRYFITNPIGGTRSVSWILRSTRDWPGFPLHGLINVEGAATETLAVAVPVPDTAAVGENALVLTVSHTGAEGNDASCAQGIDDRITATLASLVSAEFVDDAVRLVWYVADAVRYAVERSASAEPSKKIADLSPDGRSVITCIDRDVVAGSRYGYRLVRTGTTLAETWFEVPGRLAPTFRGVSPNPARGAIAFMMELPAAAKVRASLYDLAGRLVAHRDVALEPGLHRVPMATSAPLAAGLYMVRVECEGRRFGGRAVVIR